MRHPPPTPDQIARPASSDGLANHVSFVPSVKLRASLPQLAFLVMQEAPATRATSFRKSMLNARNPKEKLKPESRLKVNSYRDTAKNRLLAMVRRISRHVTRWCVARHNLRQRRS